MAEILLENGHQTLESTFFLFVISGPPVRPLYCYHFAIRFILILLPRYYFSDKAKTHARDVYRLGGVHVGSGFEHLLITINLLYKIFPLNRYVHNWKQAFPYLYI